MFVGHFIRARLRAWAHPAAPQTDQQTPRLLAPRRPSEAGRASRGEPAPLATRVATPPPSLGIGSHPAPFESRRFSPQGT
jgi:hypothetical protein